VRHVLPGILLIMALHPALADTPRWSQGLRHPDMSESRGISTGGVSLEQAVKRVRRDSGGRILSAQTVREEGRQVHRIKVLTREGRVRVYTVDARGGR